MSVSPRRHTLGTRIHHIQCTRYINAYKGVCKRGRAKEGEPADHHSCMHFMGLVSQEWVPG